MIVVLAFLLSGIYLLIHGHSGLGGWLVCTAIALVLIGDL